MKTNLVPNKFESAGVYVEGQRSVFPFKKPVAASFMSGMLVPFGDPVPFFPGTKADLVIDADIRSNTMVVPPLDPLYIDFFSVWIPHRLVWTHMPQFLGENDLTAWTQSGSYVYPFATLSQINDSASSSFMDYPGITSPSTSAANLLLAPHYGLFYGQSLYGKPAGELHINVLALRGYYLAWNYFFRDENYQRPVLFSKADIGNAGEFGYYLRDYKLAAGLPLLSFLSTVRSTTVTIGTAMPIGYASLMPVNKFHDAFTSLLPQPQFGDAVEIPLGTQAPLMYADMLYTPSNSPTGIITDKSIFKTSLIEDYSEVLPTYDNADISGTKDTKFNIVADLSKALAASVNTFRTSVMYQRYLEALGRGGRRVVEYYNTIYGVKNSKAMDDYPELVARSRYLIGVNQVIATADSSGTGWTSHLGDTGAYSYTKLRNVPVSEKDFTEFGYLHIFYCVRAANRYSQMIPQHFLRDELLSEYNPFFDHIGDVGIQNTTVNVLVSTAGNFGYQEAWWDERSQLAMATGAINKLYGDLKYWTISEVLPATLTACTDSYLTFNPAVLDDIFVSAYYTYPQFIIDGVLRGKVVKKMSAHSIPGIVGRI